MLLNTLCAHRLLGTEIAVSSLRPEEGAFPHIEYRSYEARVTPGILRAVRAAARDGADAFVIACF